MYNSKGANQLLYQSTKESLKKARDPIIKQIEEKDKKFTAEEWHSICTSDNNKGPFKSYDDFLFPILTAALLNKKVTIPAETLVQVGWAAKEKYFKYLEARQGESEIQSLLREVTELGKNSAIKTIFYVKTGWRTPGPGKFTVGEIEKLVDGGFDLEIKKKTPIVSHATTFKPSPNKEKALPINTSIKPINIELQTMSK